MTDGGAADHKIIAVPVSDVDPTYDAVTDVADLPAIERQRIEAFFRVYKNLPAGRKVVDVGEYLNADAARQVVRSSIDAYRRE